MAIVRQQNFLGQQRIDVPHLRAIESGVANDFDILAGHIISGKLPLVVTGLTLSGEGGEAEALVLKTAGTVLMHYEASEAGTIHLVPSDRPEEILSNTNPRIIGNFSPNSTNYVGLDLLRSADDSTADSVAFITPAENEEIATVPLARTVDYRILISTTPFDATPGILPIAIVKTDASNIATSVIDARRLFCRLGTSEATDGIYGWPGGRSEIIDPVRGGDRSISSLKEWLDAAMSRMWELGGGEYWYSQTADRNVRFSNLGVVFQSTGEAFEWVSGHLHWQKLRFSFDNSTGWYNDVNEQLTDAPGLTNLADGECIYVDLDRTQNRSGGLSLVAQKAPLKNLGGSARPGNRFVLAWRVGGDVFIRDQPYPIGGSLKWATTTSAGAVKISANPLLSSNTIVPLLSMAAGGVATAAGISRNLNADSGHLLAAGDLQVGRGTAAGDHNVIIRTNANPYATVIEGTSDVSANDRAALEVRQLAASPHNHIAQFGGNNGLDTGRAVVISLEGAIHLRPAPVRPAIPTPSPVFPARAKLYARRSRVYVTVSFATTATLPAYTPAGAGVGKTLTGNNNGDLVIDGISMGIGAIVLVKNETGANRIHNGIYIVTHQGDLSSPYILTRHPNHDETIEWPENVTAFVSGGTTLAGTYWRCINPTVIPDTTLIEFQASDNQRRDEVCVLWHDGSVSVIATGPVY